MANNCATSSDALGSKGTNISQANDTDDKVSMQNIKGSVVSCRLEFRNEECKANSLPLTNFVRSAITLHVDSNRIVLEKDHATRRTLVSSNQTDRCPTRRLDSARGRIRLGWTRSHQDTSGGFLPSGATSQRQSRRCCRDAPGQPGQ